jgi:hypothetical protein
VPARTLLRRLRRSLLPLTAVVLAVLLFWTLARLLTPLWPPTAACSAEPCKEAREWISFTITVLVLLAGLYQYWRAQQWKRAEFVAAAMDTFFALRGVRKATLMIDWGTRNINLFDTTATDPKHWPLVSRPLQSSALLPHTVHKRVVVAGGESSEATDSELAGFTVQEVAIRDAFDTFLDGLERFAGHVETGLLTASDLRPYLGYWLDDIASPTTDQADGEWACSLLAYIAFYRYSGVQRLFGAFAHDITPRGAIFLGFLAQVSDAARVEALRDLFDLPAA